MTEMSELEHAEASPGAFPAIPIRTEGQDLSGGHQGIHSTFQIAAGVNPVVQLLGRDYDRLEARILAQCTVATPDGGASTMAYGTASDPAAGTTVAVTPALPAGSYQVTVTTLMNGTVTVADVNNTQLLVGATVVGTLMNGDVTETDYWNPSPIIVIVPAGGAAISTKTIGAGSGTATYNQQIVATPVSGSAAPAGIVLAQTKEIATAAAAAGAGYAGPAGSFLPLGTDRTLRNCDEVWAAALSATPVLVSVIASRRLAVANPEL
jgi:hypothetical protein